MTHIKKPSPDTGKVAAEPSEGASVSRNERMEISMSKTVQKDSNLCRQACPYRLARLGTSLRVRGKLTLRKKEIIVF